MRTASAFGVSCFLALTVGVLVVEGQDRGPNGWLRNPGLTGWCETPVADRKAEEGCYTTAITELGALPREPLYWHLDTFPDRAAAEAKRGPRGTVVDGHGKHWLFTIAEQAWRSGGGDHVATIGPLVVDSGVPYTARYFETVIRAGMQDGGKGSGHRHPGPEAWFLLAGGQCLETPNGVMTAQAGQSMLAPEGWPMAISSLGPDTRRAVMLVLHRTSERHVMPVDATPDAPHAHWRPKGLCPNNQDTALASPAVAVPMSARSTPSLQGVWRKVELAIPDSPTGRKDPFDAFPGGTQTRLQPGLLIFTNRHYSRTTDTAAQPRPIAPYKTPGKPTLEELQAEWGPFVANAGTYEVSGTTVTLHAIVSKSPSGQSEKNFTTLTFKLDGNTLWLTPTGTRGGQIASPVTSKYVRVE